MIMHKLISVKTRRQGDHSMANKPILPVAVPPCSASLLFGWRWVLLFIGDVRGHGRSLRYLCQQKKLVGKRKVAGKCIICWQFFLGGKACLFLAVFPAPQKAIASQKTDCLQVKRTGEGRQYKTIVFLFGANMQDCQVVKIHQKIRKCVRMTWK